MSETNDLEHSSLGGKVTRNGLTVEIFIFRNRDGDGLWQLELEDWDGGQTCWTEKFQTDDEAYKFFLEILQEEGMESFVEGWVVADPAERDPSEA